MAEATNQERFDLRGREFRLNQATHTDEGSARIDPVGCVSSYKLLLR